MPSVYSQAACPSTRKGGDLEPGRTGHFPSEGVNMGVRTHRNTKTTRKERRGLRSKRPTRRNMRGLRVRGSATSGCPGERCIGCHSLQIANAAKKVRRGLRRCRSNLGRPEKEKIFSGCQAKKIAQGTEGWGKAGVHHARHGLHASCGHSERTECSTEAAEGLGDSKPCGVSHVCPELVYQMGD